MKHTLLIRLQGPMQAWGVQSHFTVRDTLREPTKSGVVGLLCAALGRSRDAPLDDLQRLKMGVRVDREGKLMMDFHSALDVINAAGSVLPNAIISNRYYLADALFLVGLESNNLDWLKTLQKALQSPRWLLYLGRKAFPPTAPPWLPGGVQKEKPLMEALQGFPRLIAPPRSEWEQQSLPQRLRFVLEDETGPIERMSMPRSFQPRGFLANRVRVSYHPAPQTFFKEKEACT